MDLQRLTQLLKRVSIVSERKSMVGEGILEELAPILAMEDDSDLMLPALEIVFSLSLEVPLRPHIVAVEGMVESIKRLQSRGRLKQKRVAITTSQNLQGVSAPSNNDSSSPLIEISPVGLPPIPQASLDLEEIDESDENQNTLSPLLVGKRAKGRAGVTFMDKSGRNRPGSNPVSSSVSSSTTLALYIEGGLNHNETRKSLENCLLKKDGVYSILTDLQEEKVTIRTSLTLEVIQTHIWEHCKVRATTTKGDYSSFKASGYLDDTGKQSGGWLSGLSSLLQIIAVKPDVPATPAKPAPKPAQKGQQGWLGGWW